MSGRTYPCCDCCMVKGRGHTLPCPICHPASVELAQRAKAWNEGADFVARHPDMSAEYVRAANPYREAQRAGGVV